MDMKSSLSTFSLYTVGFGAVVVVELSRNEITVNLMGGMVAVFVVNLVWPQPRQSGRCRHGAGSTESEV